MVFQKGHAGYRKKSEPNISDEVPVENKDAIEPVKTWRFSFGDLSDMGFWLLDRLRVKYPHVNDQNFVGRLRSFMDSSEFLFIRLKDAVGLAQRMCGPWDADVHVEEIFVWARKESGAREALTIYDEISRWGKSMGAKEIVVDQDCDLQREVIRGHFGKVFVRERSYVKLQ